MTTSGARPDHGYITAARVGLPAAGRTGITERFIEHDDLAALQREPDAGR